MPLQTVISALGVIAVPRSAARSAPQPLPDPFRLGGRSVSQAPQEPHREPVGRAVHLSADHPLLVGSFASDYPTSPVSDTVADAIRPAPQPSRGNGCGAAGAGRFACLRHEGTAQCRRHRRDQRGLEALPHVGRAPPPRHGRRQHPRNCRTSHDQNPRTVTPCGPYRKVWLKSSLLPRAPHQPSSIEVHTAMSHLLIAPSVGHLDGRADVEHCRRTTLSRSQSGSRWPEVGRLERVSMDPVLANVHLPGSARSGHRGRSQFAKAS